MSNGLEIKTCCCIKRTPSLIRLQMIVEYVSLLTYSENEKIVGIGIIRCNGVIIVGSHNIIAPGRKRFPGFIWGRIQVGIFVFVRRRRRQGVVHFDERIDTRGRN